MSIESHKNRHSEGTSGARNKAREMSFDVDFAAEELKDIEEKIAQAYGIERDLRTLTAARADRKQLLRILALEVLDDRMGWRRVLRQRRDALKSLAKRLRSVTKDAELLAEDPLGGAQFWLALLGMMKWEEVQWPDKSDPKGPFGSMMRMLVKHEDDKAKLLGLVLRELSQRRAAGVALSQYIRSATGRNYDYEVARLLVDARKAVGLKERKFSAEQLKKQRQRHMRPLPKNNPK